MHNTCIYNTYTEDILYRLQERERELTSLRHRELAVAETYRFIHKQSPAAASTASSHYMLYLTILYCLHCLLKKFLLTSMIFYKFFFCQPFPRTDYSIRNSIVLERFFFFFFFFSTRNCKAALNAFKAFNKYMYVDTCAHFELA